ncbi:hypothetical protein DAPPUDRAFT_241258 [Daphnia pulex]|uniref:Uncharacterized protein n=1 Tax=Daphnia pulex TaxID=6669 RepID=E9GDT9_DAPPU|nr:hypothetical protein DAPPUDRAFT_241258 [Daphnia pulex]|eukprot:EFX82140.1 hypothetical protein DAPPUDRAFT_241258 [Daphnia pulex]
MKIYILAVLLSVVCFACAQQNQTGWNYNPYHFLAAAAGRGKRSIADAPDVAAAKLEHVRAHAVAANGVVSSLPYLEPVAVWEPPQSV